MNLNHHYCAANHCRCECPDEASGPLCDGCGKTSYLSNESVCTECNCGEGSSRRRCEDRSGQCTCDIAGGGDSLYHDRQCVSTYFSRIVTDVRGICAPQRMLLYRWASTKQMNQVIAGCSLLFSSLNPWLVIRRLHLVTAKLQLFRVISHL